MGRFWTYGYWIFALLCAVVTLRIIYPRKVTIIDDVPTPISTTDVFMMYAEFCGVQSFIKYRDEMEDIDGTITRDTI